VGGFGLAGRREAHDIGWRVRRVRRVRRVGALRVGDGRRLDGRPLDGRQRNYQ
jgi:hypothetical protein